MLVRKNGPATTVLSSGDVCDMLVVCLSGSVGSQLWRAGFSGYGVVTARGVLWLRRAGSVLAVCGLSCFKACGISFPQPGMEPCLLHGKADSEPLDQRGWHLSRRRGCSVLVRFPRGTEPVGGGPPLHFSLSPSTCLVSLSACVSIHISVSL